MRWWGCSGGCSGGLSPRRDSPISIVPAEGEAGEEWCSLAAEGGDVRVSGDSGLSASRCIFALLRRHNMSVGWGRGSSGSSVRPASWEDTTIRLNALTRIRYAYNTCTFSYTMAWWGWDRWEREIDWLALRGVNLPLAFVGQEYVWKKLYSGLGLTEEEIWAHFSGGAFLAWQRMGNIEGLGGPLTDSFLAARHSLQVKILRRMSEFGMSPILPAFAGHVPLGLRRVFPNASYTTSERWNGLEETTLLQPDDPLFGEIAQGFIEAQRDAYGKLSHYYNGDTFNEMSPESAESDYLRRSGEAMVEGIKAGDPHGKWVVQGWTFTLEWWRSRPRAVEDYLSGAPNADLLVLDLFSESRPPLPLQRGGTSESRSCGASSTTSGAAPGCMATSARHTTTSSPRWHSPSPPWLAWASPWRPTGSNPIIYDMVLDMAWQGTGLNDAPLQPLWGKKNPVIPIDSLYAWEGRWVASRYGGGGSGGVEAAWQLLLHTVYEYDIEPDTAKWRIYNRPSMEPGRLSCQCSLFCEEGSPVHRAWSTLLDSPMPGVITWERDLAQFTAYILHTVACGLIVELRGIAQSPFNATSASGTLQQLEALLLDLDAVLATDTNTQLACWVKDAEAWGLDPRGAAAPGVGGPGADHRVDNRGPEAERLCEEGVVGADAALLPAEVGPPARGCRGAPGGVALVGCQGPCRQRHRRLRGWVARLLQRLGDGVCRRREHHAACPGLAGEVPAVPGWVNPMKLKGQEGGGLGWDGAVWVGLVREVQVCHVWGGGLLPQPVCCAVCCCCCVSCSDSADLVVVFCGQAGRSSLAHRACSHINCTASLYRNTTSFKTCLSISEPAGVWFPVADRKTPKRVSFVSFVATALNGSSQQGRGGG